MNLNADTVPFERALLRSEKLVQEIRQIDFRPIVRKALRSAGAVMNRHLAKSLRNERRGS